VKKSVDKGAVGRWIISDVKVNVAVYMGTSSSQKNAAIVNAADSGIYLKKGDGYLIGDHNYQGFEAIKKCKPGTVAYLDTGKQVVKYVCTKVFKGYNEKYYLTDASGVKYNLPKDYIANYTCNENSHSVTIVEFKPVEMTGQSAGSIVQGEIFEGMLDFFGGWYTR
jgi:sortase (surface protein transpeptidase)